MWKGGMAEGQVCFSFPNWRKDDGFGIVRYDRFNSGESDYVASAAIARNLDRYFGRLLPNPLDDAVVEVGITNVGLEFSGLQSVCDPVCDPLACLSGSQRSADAGRRFFLPHRLEHGCFYLVRLPDHSQMCQHQGRRQNRTEGVGYVLPRNRRR